MMRLGVQRIIGSTKRFDFFAIESLTHEATNVIWMELGSRKKGASPVRTLGPCDIWDGENW